MNRRHVLRLSGAALVATATAGCLGGGGSDTKRVTMGDDFAFSPKRLTVSAGTTVEWTNDSDVPHTVTAYEDEVPDAASYFASGGFDSEKAARNDVQGGLFGPGESYEHTFETRGTYEYFCVPHESSGMVGTVVVE
ncbi:plastocyanin/azurin family copper-binding protein [Haloferax namakaokahaiae]|uniref:Plastocyanin/azurin family copper-binding protein n=1 Tax=Haloferax namakaokahaiae TaxID=1748331 RepID=A0ABD5ZHA5_9EURY